MKRIVLFVCITFCSLYSTLTSSSTCQHYTDLSEDGVFDVFSFMIKNATCINELNVLVNNFSLWTLINVQYLKEPRFKQLIATQKQNIYNTLNPAQQTFDLYHIPIDVITYGVNTTTQDGIPALVQATILEEQSLINTLIENGALQNIIYKDKTLLMILVSDQTYYKDNDTQGRIAQSLVKDYRLPVNQLDGNGWTALDWALETGNFYKGGAQFIYNNGGKAYHHHIN